MACLWIILYIYRKKPDTIYVVWYTVPINRCDIHHWFEERTNRVMSNNITTNNNIIMTNDWFDEMYSSDDSDFAEEDAFLQSNAENCIVE